MVDAPRRDRLNVALESLLSRVSRAASGRGTILNGLVREGAKRWGRGDEVCIAWSHSTVDLMLPRSCCAAQEQPGHQAPRRSPSAAAAAPASR